MFNRDFPLHITKISRNFALPKLKTIKHNETNYGNDIRTIQGEIQRPQHK